MPTNWNEAYESGRDYRIMNQLLLERILASGLAPSGEVLDIGCGTGDLSVKLAKRGYHVTGIDLSEVAVQKAKERAASEGVTDLTNFMALNIDDNAGAQKLGDKKYHVITCKLVLAFISDKATFLAWVRDHLNDGGHLVLITPLLHPGHDYSPRMRNISVDYEQLMPLLHEAFSNVNEVYQEYFEEWGDERVFVLIN